MPKDLSYTLSVDLFTETKSGIEFPVRLVPGAKNEQILGIVETERGGKALKIAIHERPFENKANIALMGFLARMLNVPKSQISIKRGHKTKEKVIEIMGYTIAQISEMVLKRGLEPPTY